MFVGLGLFACYEAWQCKGRGSSYAYRETGRDDFNYFSCVAIVFPKGESGKYNAVGPLAAQNGLRFVGAKSLP